MADVFEVMATFCHEGDLAAIEGRKPHMITITEDEHDEIVTYFFYRTFTPLPVPSGTLATLYGVPVQVLRQPATAPIRTNPPARHQSQGSPPASGA